MFAPNDYLLAGILFLALLFVLIDLWSFEESRDFAKKRLSHYISIYQRQKQSLSYASPLVVYWDPLHDHSWNDKVCHESLSQCQSNLCSSSKLKNSIFGVVKVN